MAPIVTPFASWATTSSRSAEEHRHTKHGAQTKHVKAPRWGFIPYVDQLGLSSGTPFA
jgi:hypothetical protein